MRLFLRGWSSSLPDLEAGLPDMDRFGEPDPEMAGDPDLDRAGDPDLERDRLGEPLPERDLGVPLRDLDRLGEPLPDLERLGDPLPDLDLLGDPLPDLERLGDPLPDLDLLGDPLPDLDLLGDPLPDRLEPLYDLERDLEPDRDLEDPERLGDREPDRELDRDRERDDPLFDLIRRRLPFGPSSLPLPRLSSIRNFSCSLSDPSLDEMVSFEMNFLLLSSSLFRSLSNSSPLPFLRLRFLSRGSFRLRGCRSFLRPRSSWRLLPFLRSPSSRFLLGSAFSAPLPPLSLMYSSSRRRRPPFL